MKPGIENWATAKGIYNPAAINRKATESLTPFLLGLTQTGAAGLSGMPYIPMPTGGWHTPVTYKGFGALGQFLGGMGGMMGGMGGGGMGGMGGMGGGQSASTGMRGTWMPGQQSNPWD